MSYQYHGTTGLITLPGREVQTFPSGLVRITRTYVCRKGLEGQFRQLLAEGSVLPNDDAAPCIDGAYIFPTPLENIRDDGFVEFRVTAYGRANATGTETVSDEVYSETVAIGSITGIAVLKRKILTLEITLSLEEEIDPTTNKIPAIPEVIYDYSGIGERVISEFRRLYGVSISNYTSRNFGVFREVTVTFSPIILGSRS